MANGSVQMPSEFNEGQRAVVREIAFEAVKTFQKEHETERRQESELLMSQIRIERLADFDEHTKHCPALKTTGRLKTWVMTGAACSIGCLLGAGIINIPTLVKWIARL